MGEAFRLARERLNGEGQSHRERKGGQSGAIGEGKSFDLAERVGLLGSLPHSVAVSGSLGQSRCPWAQLAGGAL